VYAMECMVQIYDDAAAILEPLQTDDTVLKGWSIDGDITIGEYVKSLSDEQE
jgi:hypothetical protein